MQHEGKRYNEGKLRVDLIPARATKALARVLGFGAAKYGDHNWRMGQAWSTVLGSLKRHIADFEDGIDLDPESGLPQTEHMLANVAFLNEFVHTYPQGDDRFRPVFHQPKVGLDIDEVLAGFNQSYCERFKLPLPTRYFFDRKMTERLETLRKEKAFWLELAPMVDPEKLAFEPHCYITARSIPTEWTEEWLDKHGFPAVPVHSVGFNTSKVEAAQAAGVELFVDDCWQQVVQLEKAGIATKLMDRPHNRRYEVGSRRLASLEELFRRG